MSRCTSAASCNSLSARARSPFLQPRLADERGREGEATPAPRALGSIAQLELSWPSGGSVPAQDYPQASLSASLASMTASST